MVGWQTTAFPQLSGRRFVPKQVVDSPATSDGTLSEPSLDERHVPSVSVSHSVGHPTRSRGSITFAESLRRSNIPTETLQKTSETRTGALQSSKRIRPSRQRVAAEAQVSEQIKSSSPLENTFQEFRQGHVQSLANRPKINIMGNAVKDSIVKKEMMNKMFQQNKLKSEDLLSDPLDETDINPDTKVAMPLEIVTLDSGTADSDNLTEDVGLSEVDSAPTTSTTPEPSTTTSTTSTSTPRRVNKTINRLRASRPSHTRVQLNEEGEKTSVNSETEASLPQQPRLSSRRGGRGNSRGGAALLAAARVSRPLSRVPTARLTRTRGENVETAEPQIVEVTPETAETVAAPRKFSRIRG